MARLPRISMPGEIYHVFQRGNNKEFIFATDEDKLYLLSLLEEHVKVSDFVLLAFVIMSNHYHLIIRLKEIPMQNYMHRILSMYAKYYNKRRNRSGHVFEGRYNSIPVKDEDQLMDLLRYVHQNPVRAGLCDKVDDYFWSTDRFYRSQTYQGLINTSLILDSLSENRSDAIKVYINLINETVNKSSDCFETVLHIGTQKESLDELLRKHCQDEATYMKIKSGLRSPDLTPYKRHFASAARKAGYPMTAIGRHIAISQSGISRLLKR